MENETRSKEEVLKDFEKLENGKFKLKLKEPIEYGQETITEFILEKPKAKHVRKMRSNPGMDDVLKVIGKLSNNADSVIDELGMEDMNLLAEFFSVFG